VSGQGLVYNFDNTQYGSYKVRDTAPHMTVLYCALLPQSLPLVAVCLQHSASPAYARLHQCLYKT
jgi:hypothetical protein